MSASPKAFISYSWSSPAHREFIRNCADRLIGDGVGIQLDQYDLKEGHDKNAFMEKMMTDASVTHVLVFCDKAYSEKADARKSGVGTESQIISQEVYDRVEQSKFIPILCETGPDGKPYLPTFMKSRIWIDFSSPERVNENWERLIRVLFGKPEFEKPATGKPPQYILQNETTPSNRALHKFASFKLSLQQGQKGMPMFREDFLQACYQFVDELKASAEPDPDKIGEHVLGTCGKLIAIRDLLVDWVLLEAKVSPNEQFKDTLMGVLERLLDLRSKPNEKAQLGGGYSEPYHVFAYETFLYLVAALIKAGAYEVLHDVLTQGYMKSEANNYGERFVQFPEFNASSQTLGHVLNPSVRYLSPVAELFKRQAKRADITFDAVKQADLTCFVCAAISSRNRWYPQTLFYAGFGSSMEFYIRAQQRTFFRKLATITGIPTGDELRLKFKAGENRMGVSKWSDFTFHANISFWDLANMEKLDTVT